MTDDHDARILIVDDQPSNVELLEGLLIKQGYSNRKSLIDSRLVVSTFQEWHPDLILLDLSMPHMDGFAVMEALKPLTPKDDYLPILVLTADMAAETKKRALSNGAMDFVNKPFDLTEVTLRIKNLLHTRSMHQQLQDHSTLLEKQVGERTAQLRRSEERFRSLIEKSHDVIMVLDADGTIQYLSPSSETVTGYAPSERSGKSVLDFIHQDDLPEVGRLLKEITKTPTSVFKAVLRQKHRNGSWRWIEGEATNFLLDPAVNGIIVNFRDITERKTLENQVLRTQRMESIGTLAGGIAHDLNNVLAPILLAVNMLEKRVTNEEDRQMLEMIETSTKRGADLVRQVLLFARGVEGERMPVQLRHMVDELGKIIRETFPKSVFFRTDIPKKLPLVNADATQIHQVLMNLCVNARDAMPNGGTIDLKAESIVLDEQYVRMHVEAKPGPHAVITVADQGTGITPAILERIFDPFFTTKEIGKGTGLGLSTVQAIAKSHNGFVNVYSEVGKGTTFRVYLPIAQGVQTEAPEKKSKIATGNGELILVVDDEASIREITRATLEAYGYSVLTASDGTEAVAAYATQRDKVALVITDMMMPFMDGTATIRALQNMNPEVKVLAVSGLVQNAHRVAEETVKFLHKPYSAEKLMQAVNILIDGPIRSLPTR